MPVDGGVSLPRVLLRVQYVSTQILTGTRQTTAGKADRPALEEDPLAESMSARSIQ